MIALALAGVNEAVQENRPLAGKFFRRGPPGGTARPSGGRDKKMLLAIVFYGTWGTRSARNRIVAIPTAAEGCRGRAKGTPTDLDQRPPVSVVMRLDLQGTPLRRSGRLSVEADW